MFLEISQNSQENTRARVSFSIKLRALGLRPATLLKKRLWHRCFPVNFVKFLRRPFLTEHLRWLLLLLAHFTSICYRVERTSSKKTKSKSYFYYYRIFIFFHVTLLEYISNPLFKTIHSHEKMFYLN